MNRNDSVIKLSFLLANLQICEIIGISISVYECALREYFFVFLMCKVYILSIITYKFII